MTGAAAQLSTPVEVDTRLADLHAAAAKIDQRVAWKEAHIKDAAGARYYYVGRQRVTDMTIDEARPVVEAALARGETRLGSCTIRHWDSPSLIEEYDDLLAERLAAYRAINEVAKLYTGWTRFFLVTSSRGHIHRSMDCSTLPADHHLRVVAGAVRPDRGRSGRGPRAGAVLRVLPVGPGRVDRRLDHQGAGRKESGPVTAARPARMARPSFDPGPAFHHPVRPNHPIYLSGVDCPNVRRMAAEGFDVGLLSTPDTYHAGRVLPWGTWALDNGAFGAWQRGEPFDAARWVQWLAQWPHPGTMFGNRGAVRESRVMTPDHGPLVDLGCLFAVAPDVVGDAKATWDTASPWFETVRRLGFPVALAGQNGLEDDARPWDEPDRWDVLFIGGDDEWKDGRWARACARDARLMGKWVHVGRVNTRERMMAWADLADSMDGTMFRWADASEKKLRRWLGELQQPRLAV